MGGKQKQAQRTKNNARPSNSGRSAERLEATKPFATFSGMDETGFAKTKLSLFHIDENDSSVDSNYQLVMKKMQKKDATTKLKGLQEFTELVKNSDPEAVKAILPFWPTLYCTLCTDVEHKVREASHVAHKQVTLKVKKNLAPFLKQLAAPWFTSQYDTYPPAATAATQSFQESFPNEKFLGAITYCQEEILHYIYDNLINQSPQTVSNAKNLSADDCKAKYERILISSLQGYACYLNKIPEDVLMKVEELNCNIVTNKKFWKLGRNEISQIRAAWFSVLAALCQKAKSIVQKEASNVVKAVFIHLDEHDPSVQANVWEAALSVVTTIEEWWQHINTNDQLLAKLFKMLREAGNGNALVIYPHLLPLISNLPTTIETDGFYNKFFDNMRIGLEQKSVKASQTESRAIFIAFIECLQYTILKSRTNMELYTTLINTQLLPIIECSIDEGPLAFKTLFNQVSSLIQYWRRNRNIPECSHYENCSNLFWEKIQNLFLQQIETFSSTLDNKMCYEKTCRQIEFLLCMKHVAKTKKNLKVQFREAKVQSEDVTDSKNLDISTDTCYKKELQKFVEKICEGYIRAVNRYEIRELISCVYSLLLEFDSTESLEYINEVVAGGSKTTGFLEMYDNLIFPWINNEKLSSKSVHDILFHLFKYLKTNEKSKVLKNLLRCDSKNSLCWSVTMALAHPHNSDPIILEWLGSESIGNFLVEIAKKEIAGDCPPEESLLLKQAFYESNDRDELYISKECINEIIEIINGCLSKPSEHQYTIDICASLAATIASIIYTENTKLLYSDKLLLTLFTFNCNNQIDPDTLSKDTIFEVNSAWQDALTNLTSCLNKTEFIILANKFANIIEQILINSDINVISCKEIIKQIIDFVWAIQRSCVYNTSIALNILFERLMIKNWKESLIKILKESDYIKGNYTYYDALDSNCEIISQEDILKYFMWKYIVANVLASPLEEVLENDDDDDEDASKTAIINITEGTGSLVLNLYFDLALGNTIVKNCNMMRYCRKISELTDFIKTQLKLIQKSLNPSACQEPELLMISKLLTEDYLWPFALSIYHHEFVGLNHTKVYENILNKLSVGDKLARLHLIQHLGEFLSYDNIPTGLNSFESIVTLRHLCLNCNDIDVQIAEVYSRIQNIQEDSNNKFYNIDVNNWMENQTKIEIIRLCTNLIISGKINNLSRKYWDFIVISLASWSENLYEIRTNHSENIQVSSFITSIAHLFCEVEKYLKDLKTSNPNHSYVDEWKNVFEQSVTTDIIKMWLYLSDEYKHTKLKLSLQKTLFLQEFGAAIRYIHSDFIFKNRKESAPKWSKLLKRCCELMTNPVHCLQLWGCHMLIVLSPGLIEVDVISVATNKPHEKGMVFEQFKDLLIETHDIVKTMLIDFRLGEDSCRVEPYTDSYTYTFAYLLIWEVLLTLCEISPTEVKYQYSDWLRKEDLLSNLLSSLFKLMPAEVLHFHDGKTKPYYEYFLKSSAFALQEQITSENIEKYACWIYANAVSQLPASVRQWWKDVETRTSQIVERVTTAYVSPQLCLEELNHVKEHESGFKNMVIKVHTSVREVVAIYTVDESEMDLVITLPPNYPLRGPRVESSRQIGGTSHKQWLMQLEMCVTHQNGRIWDALQLWNHNLDKKFDGVEECYICFAVLHPGTYQLPKLSCKTCRKKFHAACLYKWFSTSNKSTCPICRNLF